MLIGKFPEGLEYERDLLSVSLYKILGIRLNKYVALKWTKFLKAGLHVFDPLFSVKRLSFIYMYCQWDRDTDFSGYFQVAKCL